MRFESTAAVCTAQTEFILLRKRDPHGPFKRAELADRQESAKCGSFTNQELLPKTSHLVPVESNESNQSKRKSP